MEHPLLDPKVKEQLIILEENFITSLLSENAFQTLQRIYSLLIAYYDQIEDPIRDYFLEKNMYINSRKQDHLKKNMVEEKKQSNVNIEIDNPLQIEETPLNNLIMHKELRFKRLKFTKKIEEFKHEERDMSIEDLLKQHLIEEGRLTEFIKKEQMSQESSFKARFDAIRERRVEYSLQEFSKTVGSVKDHLTKTRKKRANTVENESDKILDFSSDNSEESKGSIDELNVHKNREIG